MVKTMSGVKSSYPVDASWIGGITFNSKVDSVPLQAADFIAYETFKLVDNTFGKTPRPPRKSLGKLNPQKLRIFYLDRETLQDDVSRLIKFAP